MSVPLLECYHSSIIQGMCSDDSITTFLTCCQFTTRYESLVEQYETMKQY